MRARLPLRLARTAVFAAVCVVLASVAHVAGGGTAPAPGTAALGLGAACLLALALGGRERQPLTINLALVAAQAVLHELFGAGGPTGYVSVHPHGSPAGGMSLAVGAGAPAGRGLAVDAGMLAAHLTATLLTGWWLARGEAALWSLLRRLHDGLGRRLARVLLAGVFPATPSARQAPPVVRVRAVPPDPALRHCLARRGPPRTA
ncbi:MFS transporter [Nonomuraea rhodomycinica]|uniref:MFS transporter n=1 Tax=Nonomuraea rhodomycinica TaxID=1712872 RepID=A0A7Y6M8H5_9ACTN|nr:MFS transporter [Nonomuraea rhodomycinica]NUW39123.1 MFS transporter [Nonomuraea rhodomycinica]